ncbi:peroxidase-related enzyme [Brevibacterium otitidis]|uniref:Peroxidase-related enzyme n=1 Tax=Brevibacterium otitidis TaxID=53364 RepID=A0ABV5WXY5_9MICO
MTHTTDRYPAAELTDLPEDIRARIEEVGQQTGFVPNVFIHLARRPAEFRAFFAYYDALMQKDTGKLTKADREMIVTVTSAANKCLYCVVAHGAMLRIFEKDPFIADQVALNYRHADLPARQTAMLDFAMKVQQTPWLICDDDFAELAAHGFDNEDAWDITAITGFFGLSNRMATVTGMTPNPEFYLMGRVPRDKR